MAFDPTKPFAAGPMQPEPGDWFRAQAGGGVE